jgi:hypothetical protein
MSIQFRDNMKTLFLILIILAVIITGVACTFQSPDTTEVVVLHDITDNHLSQPDSEQVMRLFELEKDKLKGGIFRLSDITDVSFNKTNETRLETVNVWMANEFERDDEIAKFKSEIGRIINEAKKGDYERKNSSIYIPIVRELTKLKASHSNRRILLVYSDLMENTQELSYYRNGDFIRLKEDPESVKKQLEQSGKADSLSGIEIRFIYQPPDTKSDKRFREVSDLYKKMFEEKGAKVIVSASIE